MHSCGDLFKISVRLAWHWNHLCLSLSIFHSYSSYNFLFTLKVTLLLHLGHFPCCISKLWLLFRSFNLTGSNYFQIWIMDIVYFVSSNSKGTLIKKKKKNFFLLGLSEITRTLIFQNDQRPEYSVSQTGFWKHSVHDTYITSSS